MNELFLKFEDENGKPQRIPVDSDKFSIGRHSENDLVVSSSKLSRKHLEIQRFAEVFVVSDSGSSNGTLLNGQDLSDPAALSNDDELDLGGGLKIVVEIKSGDSQENGAPQANEPAADGGSDKNEPEYAVSEQAGGSDSPAKMSGLAKFLLIAPLIGIFVLLIIGVGFLLFSGSSQPEVADRENDDEIYTSSDSGADEDDGQTNDPNDQESTTTIAEDTAPGSATDIPQGSNTADDEIASPPGNGDPKREIERAAVSFMRRIARNDPSPILTSRQIEVIESKINQLKGSRALVSNIKNARQNADGIANLARSKNLKPQFLAGAALAKLGNNQGDVLQTAQGMLEVLDRLNIQIGDEVADESLVAIAAYQQGVSGQFLEMRNAMEQLSSKYPAVSSRQIRTIWFLRDKGKLSDSEFEFALRFLAVGTITQNPGLFGVSAEAVTL